MPRDGSDVYHIPLGTEGTPDTTIESEKYNSFAHDVEQDLNTPRPIVAGGTGSTSADAALDELGAEKKLQNVDNYDSFAFEAGSFYSGAGATNEPVDGHAFVGVCTINALGDIAIVARDLTDPNHVDYSRTKAGGVWSVWTVTGSAEFVFRGGDTMTGLLILSGDPVAPLGAATKQYVDIRAVTTSATMPPIATTPDGALWFESDTGMLYVLYNDGDSRQWVIAAPQPDLATYAPVTDAHLLGNPTAPTPSPGDNDTSIATTQFVNAAVAAGIATIPAPTPPETPAASAAEYLANSAPTKRLTPGAAWTASAPVTLTEAGGAVAPNLSLGIDFFWTLTAGGRTLNNPTNGKAGQKGLIYCSGGSITTWGSAYKFPGGIKPVSTGVGGAIDVISYAVGTDGATMYCTFANGFA